MNKDKVLLIYFDRKTEKYSSFNVVSLTEKLTLEKINVLADNWNKNPEQHTKVKIYEDDLLINLCEDVSATITFKNFLDSMQDMLENVQDYARNLSYEAESLQSYLKNNYPTESEE